MSSVALIVETGRSVGSAASRRLRREGKVPAIVYGHGSDPLAIAVDHRELDLAFRTEAGRNVVFSLNLEGTEKTAIAQTIDRHPYKPFIRHVDFLLVDLDEEVTADVSVTITGESPGVKEGGVMSVIRPVVQVRAILSNLPSEIVVDVSALDIGDTLRIGELPVMDGVEFLEDEGATVVTIVSAMADEVVEVAEEDLLGEEGLLEGEEAEGESEEESDE